MLDIRLLLLLTPEDRYAANSALREAEVLVFPWLALARGERSELRAARPEPEEVLR